MTDIVERLRSTPNWMREEYVSFKFTTHVSDRAPFEAADEIEKLRAENERLTNNARSDARLLGAYHKWCDMHGCAPSSSDLSKARAALGEKE